MAHPSLADTSRILRQFQSRNRRRIRSQCQTSDLQTTPPARARNRAAHSKAPEPSPSSYQTKPTGHNEREQIPTVQHPPRSIPTEPATSTAPHYKEPIPEQPKSAPTPARNPASAAMLRTHPDRPLQPRPAQRTWRSPNYLPAYRAPCTNRRSHPAPAHRQSDWSVNFHC
jgi:hypothetical protein